MILLFAILNKAGGVFGILSIFTGHPLNLWQWVYNIFAVIILPFYITGLSVITSKPPNVKKICLTCLLYFIDTCLGLLYTIYFMCYWFTREDNNPTAAPGVTDKGSATAGTAAQMSSGSKAVGLSSQSATPARELFVTIASTIIVTSARFYFLAIMAAFTKVLIKQDSLTLRYNDAQNDQIPVYEEGIVGTVKKYIALLEITSKDVLREVFRA